MALGGTNFKLRSDTSHDPYASFEYSTVAARTAGEMVLHNDTVGVVVEAAAAAAALVLVYQAARILVPCAIVTSGNLADYAEGCKVYFDATNKEVTTSSSGNTLCGIVHAAPSVGDETVIIHLMGCLGIVA